MNDTDLVDVVDRARVGDTGAWEELIRRFRGLLGAEERAAVRAAVETLSERHRHLLHVLLASPPPAYMDVADALSMPPGSIGPTRGRAIQRLRRSSHIRALAG